MDPDFQSRLNAMIAASDGAIWIVSGDRDTATQQRLWDEAVAKYGPDEARNWVAPPGHSYHEKGLAADLGGDLELAARLAPQFGLYRPMDWEPWHFEPIGSRSGGRPDPLSMTEKSLDPSALYRGPVEPDWGTGISRMFGLKSFNLNKPQGDKEVIFRTVEDDALIMANPGFRPNIPEDELPTQGPRIHIPGMGPDTHLHPNAPRRPGSSGNTDLDRFMYALRDVESNHNYKAIGVPTPWGTAKGAYQYLDSTWDNYKGYASADLAPPEIQDEKARMDMQRYYDEYGSWDDVAAAWYSGPGGNWQSGEVREYVGKVNSRL